MFESDRVEKRLPPMKTHCGLLAGCLAALLGTLFWHLEAQDRVLTSQAHHLAQTAVKNFARQAEVLARDYGYWNEAYRNLVAVPDDQWVEENIILDDLHDMIGVDAFLVLDENDKPVLAEARVSESRQGNRERIEMPRLLAGGLSGLIGHVRSREVSRPYAASAFVNLGDSVALVAISPVLPFYDEPPAAVDGRSVHLLVLLRPLTQAHLSEMGRDFALAGLEFVAKRLPRDALLPLETKDGEEVASLTWTPSHPGVLPHMFFLILVAALTLGVAGLGYRTLKSRERYCRARQDLARRRRIAEQSSANFIDHVSQDLRRPLSTITGFTQLIRTEVFASVGNQRYLAYLADVLVAARQLTDTISTRFDLSQVAQRSSEPKTMAVELSALLKDIEALLSFQLKRRDINLKVEGLEPGLCVSADAANLKQVVLELIANAVKETPAAGEVAVRVGRVDENWVEIAFADQGSGASQDRISIMLHPFDGLSEDSPRDANLGLAVIQALVRLHGGTLAVMSKAGEGTIVVLHLPIAGAKPTPIL